MTAGLVSAMTVLASWAQSGECGASAHWSLDGGTLTISGEGKMTNYFDPDGRTAPWAEYRSQINSIVIGEGITDVGDYAFNKCVAATSLSLPEGVKTLGQHSFAECESLASVTLPESLTEIGRSISRYDPNEGRVFYGCSQLKSITIPANVTIIAPKSFSLTGIESLYWNAIDCTAYNYEGQDRYTTVFENSMLEHVVFGPTVKKVPCLFNKYTYLSDITTSGTIEYVAQYAFHGTQWICDKAPGTLYIDKCLYAYISNQSIEPFTIDVREGTVGITAFTFHKNSLLTRITIPETLRYLGRYAIGECENLTEVVWNAIDCEMLDNSTPGLAVHVPMSPFGPALQKITFGPKVERLYEGFLNKCAAVTELQLPASLRRIDIMAFREMNGLKELVIPDGVEEIDSHICEDCKSLETISFGKGLKKINGYYCITGCPKIKTVNWNVSDYESVTSIGNYVTTVDNVNFGDAVKRIPALGLKCATNVTIGKNVVELTDNAFYGWEFDHINLPDGLKKMSYSSLQYCPNLTELFIPASVDSLAPNAFSDCFKLEKVIIPISRPAEKYINASSGVNNSYQIYVPDVNAYKRNFGGYDLHPMVETTPASFTYDGKAHEISLTNVMPGYEADVAPTVTVSGTDVESGEHTVWVPARFEGPRPFETEVGVTYTVDKAQDKLEWATQLGQVHVGDRIDITHVSKTLSGAQTCYYVQNRNIYNGYNPSLYADVVEEEDGHIYLVCKAPNEMILCSYMDWGDFEQFRNNWLGDYDYIYQDFDIVEESGIEGIEADSDTEVKIYSVAGVLIYAGPEKDAVLEPGIYVVKSADSTRKIAVR